LFGVLVPHLRQFSKIVEVSADDTAQQWGVHQPGRNPPARRRIGTSPRIAGGSEAGHTWLTVDLEPVVPVDDPGHGQHACDRRALEPVRM
jgi:hypothetical protein